MGRDNKVQHKHRRTILKSLGASVLGGVAGCSQLTESGEGSIEIGNLSIFSGPSSWAGANAQSAIEVVMSDIEEAGGVLGREITVNQQDTETDPQAALSGFQTLESRGAKAIVGPSSITLPNLFQPIKDAKLTTITPIAGTTSMDEVGGEYIWRTVPSDSVTARAYAKYIIDQGYESVGAAYKQGQSAQSFSVQVKNYYEEAGGGSTFEVELPPDADSLDSEVQRILDRDPDVVIMTGVTDISSLFIKAWRQQGADIPLLISKEVTSPSFIETLGADAANGLVGISGAKGPAYSRFSEAYQSVHGESPRPITAPSYDAMNIIALALENAGEATRSGVANNIREVAKPPGETVSSFSAGKTALENGNEINYEGAANPQDFNEYGDPLAGANILQVQDGEWTTIQEYSASDLENAL